MAPTSHRTTNSMPQATTPASNVPLIQYRGTGAPPVAPATSGTARAPGEPLRAEHSYGAVP